MTGQKSKVLIIGGQFTGTFCARELKKHFHVTVVDAKEYFEYTPGVLRAFVKPCHLDALTFTLQPVLERKMGVKFLWGEVTKLDGDAKTATVKTMFAGQDTIAYDYCIICSGCNFGPFEKKGESLWFPVVHEEARKVSAWGHIDERFIEGRRRHVLEEYHKIADLNKKGAMVLVVGAGFIGVEWVTELQHFFPKLKLTIIDALPNCLGPLPKKAQDYCTEYMDEVKIKYVYGTMYKAEDPAFWEKVQLPGKDAVSTYVCIGVKSSNYFLSHAPEVLSDKGPLGMGGWIHMNRKLQVVSKDYKTVWAGGCVFAVGDCNYGCIPVDDSNPTGVDPGSIAPDKMLMPPVPKISYPGEEQALHACKNVEKLAKAHGKPCKLMNTWWPWGAGMFATSLGPHDACFVLGANHVKGSGHMVNWWIPAALQKELIETTKINECKDIFIGKWIWHYVHHTPIHLWGKGCGQCSC